MPIPRRIILAGPGGAGKTTLARQVAKAKNLPFFDLDQMFCDEILDIRRYMEAYGYAAYAHRNAELLMAFLRRAPAGMVMSVSSGVLSADMAEPMRTDLLSEMRAIGALFLLVPHEDDETAARIVATRQMMRGWGLRYERERQKYLRRIDEYRRLGLTEILGSPDHSVTLRRALTRIDAAPDRIG